jgi:plasmid replication initiation protein
MVFTTELRDLALQFGFKKTKRYKQIKNAIDTATKQVLRFEKEDGQITEWMPWLIYCNLNIKTNTVIIQINPKLYEYVIEIRQDKGFSFIF